jgi:formate dehydrogenase major subunit
MKCSRRGFMKLAGAGAVCVSLGQLGVDLKPVAAYAAGLKIDGAKEVNTVCPFCSLSCHIIAYVNDGKLVSTEGDPDYPISRGSLCAKGASLLSMTRNDVRLTKPLYRAANSDKWEEKDWDFMFKRIAQRVKETRDRDFIATNAKGQQVNRIESMFFFGTSHADNEECALAHQALRSLGIVHVDHQARV